MIRNKIRSRRKRLIDREEFLYDSGALISSHSHYIPYPPTNVKEHEAFFDLELAINDFNKEELTVLIEGNMLTVEGEKENRVVRDELAYIQKEYDFDSFKRVFELDDITDPSKTEAFMKEEKLFIRLYHKEETEETVKETPSRTIPIL